MIRNIFFSFLLLVAGVCYAAPLTPQQALARVKDSANPEIATRGINAIEPIMILSEALGEPTLYVFDDKENQSFMVVSADDATIPLLGYSDHGFDKQNMPPALEYWLNEYSRQIQYLRDNNIVSPSTRGVIQLPDWEPVAPLLKTKWDQLEPYNDMCPVLDGVRVPSGCVATATSQVMKYFNHPAKPQGSVEYTYTYKQSNGNEVEVTNSMDFNGITFDWNNMLDNYNGNATQAQKDAVALLTKAVGYAVEMMYAPDTSGAYSSNIAPALVNYFNYDKDIRFYYRTWFNYSKWGEMIYDNIKNVGPVIYGGSGTGGGHSFVLDGYSSGGYFHVNWGWNGMSDGYYVLDALDPYSLGTGGGTGGFNFYQDAVVNIKKPVTGNPSVSQANICIYGSFGGKVEGNTLQLTVIDSDYPVLIFEGFYESMGNVSLKIEEVENPEATPVYLPSLNLNNLNFRPGYGYYANDEYPMTFDLTKVSLKSNTQYKMTVGVSFVGQPWQPVFTEQGYSNYIYLIKKGIGTNANYTVTSEKVKTFGASDVKLETGLYIDYPIKVSGTIFNDTDIELTNSATICILDENINVIYLGENFLYSIAPGESVEEVWNTSLDSYVDNPEDYIGKPLYLGILDYYNMILYYLDPNPVTLQATPPPPVVKGNVYVDNASIKDGVYMADNAMSFDVTTEISVESGFFCNETYLYIFQANPAENNWISSFYLPYGVYEVKAGETSKLTMTASFPDAVPGERYALASRVFLPQGTQWVGMTDEGYLKTFVTFLGNAGVDDILSDGSEIMFLYNKFTQTVNVMGGNGGIENVEVYSINGVKMSPQISGGYYKDVDLRSLGKGVIVVTATDRKGNHSSTKIVL